MTETFIRGGSGKILSEFVQDGTLPFRVRLSTPSPLTHALTVTYALVSATALVGEDVLPLSGTVTFPVGSVDGKT